MHNRTALIIAICSLGLGACATSGSGVDQAGGATAQPAQDAEGETQAAGSTDDQAAAEDPNAIECKTVIITGTRVGTRQCLPRSEWERMRAASQDATQRVQQRSAHGQGPMTQGGGS